MKKIDVWTLIAVFCAIMIMAGLYLEVGINYPISWGLFFVIALFKMGGKNV